MEFGEVLRRRRMIRSYDMTRPVPPAAIDAVLAAALRAPSAGFTQGISFLVLSSDAERETFWRLTGDSDTAWLRGMRTAPVLVLVWTSEAGMASMAALLSAVDQHLGACFFGIPADRIAVVRETFGVPASQLSVGVISLGYSAAAPEERLISGSAPARRPRKVPTDLIHHSVW